MAIDSRKAGTEAQGPRASLLNDPQFRALAYQVLVVGAVVVVGWYLVSNTLNNLARQNIATGFGFLDREASFAISESLIDYSPASTYGRAFAVGLLNTLKASLVGIVLATILGTIIGIARLSSNWLVARLATIYVEAVRNVPLLLQLFLWYGVVTESLPHPRQALSPIEGVFLSNRGFILPAPVADPAWLWAGIAFAVGIGLAFATKVWADRRQAATGRQFPTLRANLALILGLPLLAWLLAGAPIVMDMPELRGFNFVGGISLSPEFAALLIGLVVYTASYIAEIVRSGILAVNYGQTEAGLALGLQRSQVLRLVILPQSLRVIVPPITSQYLNLMKNSSLAVAIGYPDVVSIANTTMNQTGQAIEGVALIMAVYLTISLAISLFMNWYNKKIALVER